MKTDSLILAAEILLVMMLKASGQSTSIVQFAAPRYAVSENGGTVTLVVERFGAPGASAYVEYVTRDGSATHGEDYVEQTGFLYFIGETNLTIEITVQNDAVAERDEMFVVSLLNPDPFDTELGTVTDAVVTILDNDRGVEFSASTFSVGEGAGQALIAVRGGTDSTNGFSVEYTTSEECSATAGVDYLPQSGTLTFGAGDTEKTFFISIMDDAVAEGDEYVRLSLRHPVGVALGTLSNAVLRIRDNEPLTESQADLTPQRVGIWSNTLSPHDVAVSGNYVYVADGPGGLLIIDASDTAHPQPCGRVATGSDAFGVAVACNNALVVGWRGLDVFDVSDPANPHRVGQLGGGCRTYTAMAVEGSRAVLIWRAINECGGNVGGLDIIDISDPANPQVMGSYRSAELGPRLVSDVSISGEFAYLGGGVLTLQVIDISDPSFPHKVADLAGLGDPFHIRPVNLAASGNFVYSAGYVSLFVIDFGNPADPQEVGTYAPIDIGTPIKDEPSHLAVAGGRLYVAGSAGLELIDVRDPTHPRQSAFYQTDSEVMAVAVRGDRAFLAGSTGLEIIDLNPLGFLPGSIARLADGQVQFSLNTRTGRSYTVQASTNLVDWETLETRTAAGTRIIYTDADARHLPARFYRAVQH